MGSVVRLVLAEWFSPLRPRPSFETARRACALARSRAHHSSCAVATPNRRGANSEYKKLSTENRKIVLPAIAPKRDRHPRNLRVRTSGAMTKARSSHLRPLTLRFLPGVAHALLCLTRFSAMLY